MSILCINDVSDQFLHDVFFWVFFFAIISFLAIERPITPASKPFVCETSSILRFNKVFFLQENKMSELNVRFES